MLMLQYHRMNDGFLPVFDGRSKVLILGSFPSVKSREVNFYYGNKRNRFWGMLGEYFGETVGETIEEKVSFLHGKGIALWDVLTACSIEGSSDSVINATNGVPADLYGLLEKINVTTVLCNGKKAYELFLHYFPDSKATALCLPSTSPANVSFSAAVWYDVFDRLSLRI